ncbi:MAG TPA: histidinol dehydrogenase, partial [Candidatus Limiplasma pullistercoris]|nr:histidinol dehydrogenase [Candidatus Limiplasma pullistercoris]
MIRIVSYEGQPAAQLLDRAVEVRRDVTQAVEAIVEDVRLRGDEAVLDYCETFDGARPDGLLVPEEELDAAFSQVEPEFLDTLRLAARNIERFHRLQKRAGFVDTPAPGVVVGQRVLPLSSAGLYVPGGTARYPSSVLMDAIPAKIAGVETIVMTTPPGPDGKVPAPILAAAKLAGVRTVVRAGGAQAIAALAFGTQSIPRVDKIVGPGNIYVATAKQLCYARGLCDIDMVAGPSEIMIVSDANSNPVYLAADLLSQAEHDRLSSAWLAVTDAGLAKAVADEVERQLKLLPRQEIARASIEQNGRILVVDSLETAARLADEIAPEHLELCVDDPFGLLPMVHNAGSV